MSNFLNKREKEQTTWGSFQNTYNSNQKKSNKIREGREWQKSNLDI